MFAHRSSLFKGLVVALCAIALAGCGGDDSDAGVAATGPDTAKADPADVDVIEGWAGALAVGDVGAAADYFAIPSTAENGPLLTKIDSRVDAIAFNESLPCGAKVVSAQTAGDFTTATFELSDRPGGDCGPGAGGTASTSFQIEDGKIIEWRRIDGQAPAGEDQSGDTVI
jgi:hypothetical protein